MTSVEIICCLSIVIFALAVAHPLPDNEQVEAKLDPSKPALLLNNPSKPAFLLNDPSTPAFLLNDPSTPAFLLKDPTASGYLQKLPAEDNAASSDMSQDDLQEQQDPEAIMFSEETLEATFNDTPEERELQQE